MASLLLSFAMGALYLLLIKRKRGFKLLPSFLSFFKKKKWSKGRAELMADYLATCRSLVS
jgi:hypothetical protein